MHATDHDTALRELGFNDSEAAAIEALIPEDLRPAHTRWAWLLPSAQAVLVMVLLVSTFCRVVWLSKPTGALIFDEAYYVNAARVMLGWDIPAGAPYAGQPVGRDPNREHPPLGKAIIAESMRLLGDDAIGWRLPSVLAGSVSILLLYGIVRAAGGDRWLAILAAALFGMDNLALVHSRIASLDMMLVAWLLLGAWCAIRGWPLLAGVSFALAALTKLNGIYGLFALVLVVLIQAVWAWRARRGQTVMHVRRVALLLLGCVPLWIGALWLLDWQFSTYQTPWEHLQYILQYGLSLTRPGGPINQESYPWQWLLNEVPMTYLRTEEQVLANDQVVASYATVFFRGAMNPFIIGVAPLAAAYAVWRTVRFRDTLALWVVAWIVATYLPFFPLAMVQHRISYIFYFLPTLPAVAVAVAMFVRDGSAPRFVLWAYLCAVLVGFVAYFPFRTLPS
jgi:dolichyl-phosphate-mannose-protein mannosyltransferase